MIEFKGSWDMHLSLMEFAYNNNYQSSIGMAPFEALYSRKFLFVIIGSNDIYKFMTLSPKDYYLIPSNNSMKLVCCMP